MPVAEVSEQKGLRIALLLILLLLVTAGIYAQAVSVELVQSADGNWQLLRAGQPYYVLGAGGDGSKELLAACGANTFRTWGVGPDLEEQLDQAWALGLTVIVGHWLGHERHGFDYQNAELLNEQKARVRADVLAYKDHPAVLIWGLGNEMEGIGAGDDPAIWNHIQELAALVKELDPFHPTMVVTADIGGKRVEMIHKLCPDIDIMGINTYGGLPSLPSRYKELGGTKPYLVTEFGPPGVWETGRTEFGVPPELSSTQKAVLYQEYFQKGCLAEPLCLGGCAFLWGSKPEATATWFGMLLPGGAKLAAVDAMTEIWSGKPPSNLCPEIRSLELAGPAVLQPGQTVKVNLEAVDPEGVEVKVDWKVCPEAPQYDTFGETWWQPLELGGIIVSSSATQAELIMPSGGLYRLYVTVLDGSGGAATANIPFKVEGEPSTQRLKLPLDVFADGAPQPWAPSGWMGDYQALSMDAGSRVSPHSGDNCLEFRYAQSSSWAGVVWQDPPNDWGELPGGYDLTGAKQLTFWARGAFGGEIVNFGVGLLGPEKKFSDTLAAKLEAVKLTQDWKQYRISLKGKDLSRIKTPFYWSASGQKHSLTLYLDDIRFE
ncbi:MAG: hypothetical protein K0B87_00400 [Candidatus Syntrophosphaera sp.]|nr:hypothetical protein [Candidatus Syntrophosphaera sp.]